jgi:hypothetical protein
MTTTFNFDEENEFALDSDGFSSDDSDDDDSKVLSEKPSSGIKKGANSGKTQEEIKSERKSERKRDNEDHTRLLKTETPVSITPHAELRLMFESNKHPFSAHKREGDEAGDTSIRGRDPDSKVIEWESKAELLMRIKEHGHFYGRKFVTHQDSHPVVDGLLLATNTCRKLICRCNLNHCSYFCYNYASLIYDEAGEAIAQQWKTYGFSPHVGVHPLNTTKNTSPHSYTSKDFANSLQNQQHIISNITAATIRTGCQQFTTTKITSSMVQQIRNKLTTIIEGKFDETINLIPTLIRAWRRAGHYIHLEIVNGTVLKKIATKISKKAWKKEMKTLETSEQFPFDKAKVNISGVEVGKNYPICFELSHRGLLLLADGDSGRRTEQDASHNKGALKGSHAAIIVKTGMHKVVPQMISWTMFPEGGELWRRINRALNASAPYRLERPSKYSVNLFFIEYIIEYKIVSHSLFLSLFLLFSFHQNLIFNRLRKTHNA